VNERHADLLAGVLDELRVPLNRALILSKLLADNGSVNLTPEQVKFAGSIYAAGNDLLELLNDLLDLASIAAHRIDIRPEPLALRELITALAQAFAPEAEEKRLGLEVHLARDLPATLESDAQRLPQVLRNLVATAIRLTDRGTVSLEVARREAGIEFVVGAGAGRSQAAGLRLTLARELAVLLGGCIEVQSAPDRASLFRFFAPAVALPSEHRPAQVGA
jgi:signal transduction histidine kinase